MNKILGVILVILLGIGGFLFLGNQRSQAGQQETKLLNLPVEGIVTNLADGHYARISLVLEYANPDATSYLTESQYKIKAVVIQEMRQKKVADLQDLESLKDGLKTAINDTVEPWKITGIYITDFITQ